MTFILPSTTIQGKRAAIVTNYFIFVGSCCALLSYRESSFRNPIMFLSDEKLIIHFSIQTDKGLIQLSSTLIAPGLFKANTPTCPVFILSYVYLRRNPNQPNTLYLI